MHAYTSLNTWSVFFPYVIAKYLSFLLVSEMENKSVCLTVKLDTFLTNTKGTDSRRRSPFFFEN